MSDLTLEPYAVLQRWSMPGAEVPWDSLLADYLQAMAHRCDQEAGKFLGHIKALALFAGDQYLRLSVIDPRRPATVEGHVPAGQNTLELTVNVIVYGLKHELLQKISEETAAEISAQWNVEVTSQAIHPH